MTWKLALDLATLREKERETVVLDGQKILVIWHNEQVYALQAQCPHLKLPLSKGEITKECSIICPFHKSEFDLHTGSVKCWSTWPPVLGKLLGKAVRPKHLRIYPTRIEQGKVQINVAKEVSLAD